ncbi:MAG: hypothetical protein QRY71_05830 [Candidatus Rhabdochlamydia sp.]
MSYMQAIPRTSASTYVTSWISQDSEIKLDFYCTESIYQDPRTTYYTESLNQDGRVRNYHQPQVIRVQHYVAKLFQKNSNGVFVNTNIHIPESCMLIETKNVYDLMRGVPQQIFNVSELNSRQKQFIMQSLESRNITVERNFHSANLIIHALP